ncbi:MAG: CoA-binding protein [Promethearchaeota archaeon]
MPEYNFKDLSFIRDIKSIAIVGISKKNKFYLLRTFTDTFKGRVYAIKPGYDKIEGFPDVSVYDRIIDIPDYEPVDFVFISIPRENVIPVIDDCIQKGVKLVAIFTANFADAGTEEGKRLQQELINHIEGTAIKVLGPNGMGLTVPKLGLRWRMYLPLQQNEKSEFKSNFNLGIMGQSGGLLNLLYNGFKNERINISAVFSLGNQINVNLLDTLNYFKEDPETNYIFSYIEGLSAGKGRIFMKMLRIISHKKPVLILKAGRTDAGSQAAITHTASVIGNFGLWKQAISQAGGILLETYEDVINITKYINCIGLKRMEKISMMSLSGGFGVISTDVLAEYGLKFPSYKPKTMEKLSSIFGKRAGVSFKNPIDLAGLLYNPKKMNEIIRALLSDNLDGIVLEIPPFYLRSRERRPNFDLILELQKMLKIIRKEFKKPILIICEEMQTNGKREELKNKLELIGIPVYSGILPVTRTLKSLNTYLNKRRELNKNNYVNTWKSSKKMA